MPDMTKENMPVTSQDIEKVQFPEKITDISVLQAQQQSPWLHSIEQEWNKVQKLRYVKNEIENVYLLII